MFKPDQAQVASIRQLMGELSSTGMQPRVLGTYMETARRMVSDGEAGMDIFKLSAQAFKEKVEPHIYQEGGQVAAASEGTQAARRRQNVESRFEDLDAVRERSSNER